MSASSVCDEASEVSSAQPSFRSHTACGHDNEKFRPRGATRDRQRLASKDLARDVGAFRDAVIPRLRRGVIASDAPSTRRLGDRDKRRGGGVRVSRLAANLCKGATAPLLVPCGASRPHRDAPRSTAD